MTIDLIEDQVRNGQVYVPTYSNSSFSAVTVVGFDENGTYTFVVYSDRTTEFLIFHQNAKNESFWHDFKSL